MPIDLGRPESPMRLLALRSAACFGAAAVLVAGLLVGGTTSAAVGLVNPPWDKLLHLVTYATLGLLIAFGFNGRRPLLSAGLAFATGVVDELMQVFTSGRHPDVADLGADLGGVLLAAASLRMLWRRRG